MCKEVQCKPMKKQGAPLFTVWLWWVMLCVTFLMAPLASPVVHAETLFSKIDGDAPDVSVAQVLEYWLDDADQTDSNTVLHNPDVLNWVRVNKDVPSFGFDKRTYWYRFGIENSSNRDEELVLEIDYPVLDFVDVYLLEPDGRWELHRFGDKIPFSARTVKHHNFILPFHSEPNSKRQILIRVQTNGSHQVPLVVWKRLAFEAHDQNQLMGQGIYFGVMMVMVLYNLFIYMSVRDASYLFYVGSVASFTMFQSGIHGFSFQYFWPNALEWNDTAIAVCIGCFGFFGSMSVLTFLRLKQYSPFFYKAMVAYASASIVCVVLSFILPYDVSVRLNTVLGGPGHIVCLAPGIYLMLKGHWHARFFVIGWTLFLCSTLVLTLNKFGILPVSFMTEYASQIGSLTEVVLFSFALADRINFIRQERDRLEKQNKLALMEANRSLEESNRLKDEFLATISHELRTPMNGVIGCLDNMSDTDNQVNSEQYRRAARQSAREMMRLVERILGYTEIQSGQLVMRQLEFNLNSCVRALAEEYRQRAEGKGLSFTLLLRDIPDLVVGDETHLRQVLEALLDNAVKFTRNGGITLSIKGGFEAGDETHCRLQCIVSDSGEGVPLSARETLFEKFNQIDSAFNRSHGGLGIGLATSQALIKAMGGAIEYRPCETCGEEGGSTFFFNITLPCKTLPKTESHQMDQDSSNLDLNGKHVLVVEDNPVNQMVIKGKLKKQGADVLLADNGQIALELIQQSPIDVVLMDCQMPVMDGFEATRCIRRLGGEFARVPIIAVTANAMSKDRERCLDAGMNDYLSKPVDSAQLLTAIQRWVV